MTMKGGVIGAGISFAWWCARMSVNNPNKGGAALTVETQNPYVATGSSLSAWAMKNTSNTWVSAGVTEYHSLSTMSNNIASGDTTWEVWDTRY